MTRESPVSAGRDAQADSPRESCVPVPRVLQSGTASPAFEHGESCVPVRRVLQSGTASRASGHGESGVPVHADLAARQAELVAALAAGAPDPAGFDARRLAVTRRALLRKRAGAAAVVWPLLAASLGPDWPAVFAASVDGRPPAGALVDGWELARSLRRRRELGDAAAVELAEREVTLRRTAVGVARRRLPALRRTGHGVVVQLAGRVTHLPVQ